MVYICKRSKGLKKYKRSKCKKNAHGSGEEDKEEEV